LSRYPIYRIDHFDPDLAGKERRRQVWLYAGFSVALVVLLFIGVYISDLNESLFYSTYSFVFLSTYYILTIRIRSKMKRTAVIGEIEFTRTGIKKRLGDAITEYDYNSVSRFELRKHFPNLWFSNSKSGYFSHILKISFTDNTEESLVLADKPLEKKPEISIAGTLTALKKLTPVEIVIDK